jgi:hypothetical protein
LITVTLIHLSIRSSDEENDKEEEEKEEEEVYFIFRNSTDTKERSSDPEQESESGSEASESHLSDSYNDTDTATPGDLGVKKSSPCDPQIPQVTPTIVGVKRDKRKDSNIKATTDLIAFIDVDQSSDQSSDGDEMVLKKISSTRQNNYFLKITKKMKTDKYGISSVSFSCENSKHETGSGINSGISHQMIHEVFGTNCSDDSTVNGEKKSNLKKSSFILPSTVLLWKWILPKENIPRDDQKKVLQSELLEKKKFSFNSPNNYSDRINSNKERSFGEDYSDFANSRHTGMTNNMKNCQMKTTMKINKMELSPKTLGCHRWDGMRSTDTAHSTYESDSDYDYDSDNSQCERRNNQCNAESRIQVPSVGKV